MEIYYNNAGIILTQDEFIDIISQGYSKALVEIVIAIGSASLAELEYMLCEGDLPKELAAAIEETLHHKGGGCPSDEDIHVLEILRSLGYLIPGDERP